MQTLASNNRNAISDMFVFCSLICICNVLLRQSNGIYIVLTQSFSILNRHEPNTSERQISKFLSQNRTRLQQLLKSGTRDRTLGLIDLMTELWLDICPQDAPAINSGKQHLFRRAQEIGIISWPAIDAFYIWNWIHLVALHIDLNRPHMSEKKNFARFVCNLINCGECAEHYRSNLETVLQNCQLVGCANTFYALHTFLNKIYIPSLNPFQKPLHGQFIFKRELIDNTYAKEYLMKYAVLKYQ